MIIGKGVTSNERKKNAFDAPERMFDKLQQMQDKKMYLVVK